MTGKSTKFTNVSVSGVLEAEDAKIGGKLETGDAKISGKLDAPQFGAASVETAVDYTLTAEEAQKTAILIEATAASKSVVLGLTDGQVMHVINVGGTNAVTVKAVEGDTGTSLAAGKVAIVVGAEGADASKIYVLN